MRRATRLSAAWGRLALGIAVAGWCSAVHAADVIRLPAHQRVQLASGLTLVMVPQHDLPLLSVTAVVRGGASQDRAGKAGTAALTADLLTHGAGSRDAYAFADAVEGAGGSFDVSPHLESITVNAHFLARDQALLLELLGDVLMRPQLDAGEFDKLRTQRIELIKAAKDSEPEGLLTAYGRSLLFAGHPFGHPLGGSENSLAAIRLADVAAFYREQVGADRTTLVVAGDFDPVKLQAEVARVFAHWRHAGARLAPLPVKPRVTGRRVLLVDAPGSTQTYFWMGNVGVARNDPDRAALDLANTIFGGRFTSMLNTELRIKSGLSYGASSGFTRASVPLEFAISSFTRTEDTQRALDLTLATLTALHRDPLAPEVIDSARNYLLGQYPLEFETAANWAAVFAELELYALPPSYVSGYGPALARVNAGELRRVIDSAFPTAADLDIVLIGDAARIRGIAAGYGKVQELPLEQGDFEVGAP
ncbi:MAG TPA: pitrilysin family protein [Steroidobacteraceae bacterium]|nr:pitrilysin family protein [Steroidobacteraceae bacterium]